MTPIPLGRNERDPAGLTALSMRLYRYFHILVERCQHPYQLFHRNLLRLIPEQLE